MPLRTPIPSHMLTKTLCVFLFSPQIFHVLSPPVGRWSYSICSSLQFLETLSHRYLPQHPILKHPQPMFFTKYDQPCFTPIYNRHSTFKNDIPLWYMMINHNHTYISFLLVACFGCCEKQIIILQRCIENIIMYFLIPLRWFFTKAKTCSRQ